MTVIEIVIAYLKDNGYDGLRCDYYGDACGCLLDNLMPCGGGILYSEVCLECEPGYKLSGDDYGGWYVGPEKPRQTGG